MTGQHRHLLDQALTLFGLQPDHDFALMTENQEPAVVTDRVFAAVCKEIDRVAPDWIVIQGDTASALGAARAGASVGIPVAHVEAGLRSGDITSPWPEELQRREISALARLHFAPTPLAADNLRFEGISPQNIFLCGNPVIDAVRWMARRLDRDHQLASRLQDRFAWLDSTRRLILATVHRREWRQCRIDAFIQIVLALAAREDVEIVVPLHPSPQLTRPLVQALSDRAYIHPISPPDYAGFLYLLRKAALLLTDSGGLQEEAPELGKPLLILRERTERPEAIKAGAARLVGLSVSRALVEARELLDDAVCYARMSRPQAIFGDGFAASRIARCLLHEALQRRQRRSVRPLYKPAPAAHRGPGAGLQWTEPPGAKATMRHRAR